MILRKIFDALPPPKFLDIPFAGLSISDSAVRCIKFGKKNGGLFIEKYAEKTISQGLITSGEINNKEEIKQILLNLKKDLKLDRVKISLPEEKAYLFTAKIPIVKGSEVKSVIESKIEENVPVPGAELVFDYRIIDHRKRGHLDVVVSSFPIPVVDLYVEIVAAAGFSLLSLEIESQAIASALLEENTFGTVLLINFGKEKVGLYIASDRIVRFTSTITLKGDTSENPSYLSQEVKKLFTYWHTLKENLDRPDKKINNIVACGENFDDELVSYISSHNKTPAKVGDVWINAFDVNKIVPIISFSDSLKYAVAVGLALPSDTLI